LFSFKFCPDSRDSDLFELRDLEFLRGASGQDGELVQREFVLVIAASDEAVHWNHAIIAKGRTAVAEYVEIRASHP
jgi:hypothetical protein